MTPRGAQGVEAGGERRRIGPLSRAGLDVDGADYGRLDAAEVVVGFVAAELDIIESEGARGLVHLVEGVVGEDAHGLGRVRARPDSLDEDAGLFEGDAPRALGEDEADEVGAGGGLGVFPARNAADLDVSHRRP